MTVTYLIGDTRERIKQVADNSIALVATSPPFVALRNYLPADHPMKAAEIGTEPDPATFIDTLLVLVSEWSRVLTSWGSIAVELGDSYAGGSAQGTDQTGTNRYPNGRGMDDLSIRKAGDGRPRPKSLALVPQAFALSLAYGRNVLTGERSPAGQWLVRNMVVWHRSNPAVGALGDKYRPSTSYIVIATRSPKRWFDLTAVRTQPTIEPAMMSISSAKHKQARQLVGKDAGGGSGGNPAGAPPLDAWFDEHDVWSVNSQPSKLAHFAMWPPRLAERLILSMCPHQVCATCGEPRKRIEEPTDEYRHARQHLPEPTQWDANVGNRQAGWSGTAASTIRNLVRYTTVGWSDCGHDDYRPGVVLDPFAGTGTTLAVAHCHQRDAIGIDIDARNRQLYDQRLIEVQRSLFNMQPTDPRQMKLWD